MSRRFISTLFSCPFVALWLSAAFLTVGFFLALRSSDAGRIPAPGKNTPPVSTVELRENGFYPPVLTVAPGDTVTFTTTRGQQFWPASNLHPTHTLYPEFDPREPVAPDASWSFTFKKAGTWEYHDHLAPIYRGAVEVGEEKGEEAKEASVHCGRGNNKEKRIRCWQKSIDAVVGQQGLAAGFTMVRELYGSDPEFARVCHDIMHRVGEAAYKRFANKDTMTLTPDTAFCSYGFYHGFIETLVAEGGNPDAMRSFCLFVDKQLKADLPDALYQCLHGLAHGAVLGEEDKFPGDEQAMIAAGKKLCLRVSSTPEELFRCGTGVFDPISISYFTHQHDLAMNPEDPFWLCRLQKEDAFRSSCYVSMDPALMWLLDLDFKKAVAYIEAIPEDAYAVLAVRSLPLPASFIRIFAPEETAARVERWYQKESIPLCQSLGKRLHLPCIEGIASALVFHEGDEDKYKDGFLYCNNNALTEEERRACFGSLFSKLRTLSTRQKMQSICALADERYRDLCVAL